MIFACTIAALLALAPWVEAQTASIGKATKNAAEADFTAGANEILVDVVVRDKRGRILQGIKASDITVLEDGLPQEVTAFREVRRGNDSLVPSGGPLPRSTDSQIRVDRQIRLVTLVFERLQPESRRLARQAGLDFLKLDNGSNIFYSVMYNDRRLTVLQPFTTDLAKLRAAVEAATTPQPMDFINDGQSLSRVLNNTQGSEGAAAAASAAGQAGPTTVDGGSLSDEQAARFARNMVEFSDIINRETLGRASIFSLWGVIQQLGEIPGRKSILYFSEGLQMPNGVWGQFAGMISSANRKGVSIYAIDARGLLPASDQAAADARVRAAAAVSGRTRSTETNGIEEFRNFENVLDATRGNVQNNLRELAESTGGTLIANTNDMRPQLKKISEDFNSYYEVSYKPLNSAYDGRYRKIEVRVNLADAQVQARDGYFSLPNLGGVSVYPHEVPMLKVLSQNPLPKDIGFRANILHFKPGGQEQAALVFDLPLSSIKFARDEVQKIYKTHISVMALIKNSEGQVVAKLSRDLPLTQPIDKVDALTAGRYIVTQPVQLAPGRYTMECVVADHEANRSAAKRSAVVIPVRGNGPAVSSVSLVRRMDKVPETAEAGDPFVIPQGKVVPFLGDSVPGGANSMLSAYFVLYPGSASTPPRLVLDLMQDGKLLSRLQPPLEDPVNGAIPYMANIPLAMVPKGQVELRATLLQGEVGSQSSLFVNIE